jgi:hypothetical protein
LAPSCDSSDADGDMESQMTGCDSLVVPLASSASGSEYDDYAELDNCEEAAKAEPFQDSKRKQDEQEAKRNAEKAKQAIRNQDRYSKQQQNDDAKRQQEALINASVDSDDEVVYGPVMPPAAFSSSSGQSSDLQNLASRLVDVDDSAFADGQSALSGIFKAESLSFPDAIKRCGVKGVAVNAMCAAKHGAKMKNHGASGALSADQIAAIHMYTQACDFYRAFNECLRDRDRQQVKPFFPYLRLLLEGLRQLPAQKRAVYRGVKLDLSTKFRKGDQPVWWSVTSTSSSMDVLQSKDFCGQDGPRTVFMVQATHARNIAAFSAFASEEEWILLPGAQLRVKSVVAMGGGLQLVQMDEIGVPMSLIEFEEDN